MATYRVQVSVGVDVEAETDGEAMTEAIAKVRALIGDTGQAHPKPAWVTGIVAAINGMGTTDKMVFRQADQQAYTRTATGARARIVWCDAEDEAPADVLLSFGEFDERDNTDGYDTMGYRDDEVFFYTNESDIERLREPDNGEDFYIVGEVEIDYAEG